MSESSDEDLVERIERLERSLQELQSSRRMPRRGPFGLPRPPSPGDVVRYLDDYALPTAISFLEMNIRTLELVRGTIRLLDTERGIERDSQRSIERVDEIRRTTLTRLDDALVEIQQAVRDGRLPPNEDARRIVEDAQRLRSEIASRVEDVDPTAGTERDSREDRDSEHDRSAPEPIDIDIEDELESIRDELDASGDDDIGSTVDDSPSDDGRGSSSTDE